MPRLLPRVLFLALLSFSSFIYACGDNPHAIVQGPFKDSSFPDGFICFQNTAEKRDVEFYLSFTKDGQVQQVKVDTFEYSDAPAELMTVFFMPVDGQQNVVVLLRWQVNYSMDGVQYPYYYEVKTYQPIKGTGYASYLNESNDSALSGYQTQKNAVVTAYPLDNAAKIKKYLRTEHGG